MQLFIHLSLLFPFGITIILVSYIFGYLLKCIHEDNEVLYKSSLVCVGSPNGISLPIMVMASLCENSDVNADYDGDADQCFDEASSMMFIYIIPWFLFFWSYGYSTLSSIHDKAPAAEDSSNDDDKKTASVEEQKSIQEKYTIIADKLWLVLRNPALLGVYLGLFIGLIPGLGDFLFNKVTVLQPFGGAVEVLATPVVALNSLVMSASLAHINVNWADLFPWLITRRDKGGYEYQDSSHGAEDEGVNDQDLRMEVELEVMDISDVGITRSGCGQPRSRTSSKNSTDFSLGVLTCSAAHEEARAGAGTEVMGSGIHSLHTDILLGEEVKDREEQGDRSSSTCAIISANARHNDQYTETRSRHTVSFSTDSDLEEEQVTHHTIITDIPQFRSIVFIILCRYWTSCHFQLDSIIQFNFLQTHAFVCSNITYIHTYTVMYDCDIMIQLTNSWPNNSIMMQ